MSAATDKGVLAVLDRLIAQTELTKFGERPLTEARATVAELMKAAKLAVESDGGTRYDGDDDEIGCRACCMVLSYRDHTADCWVPRMAAALARCSGEVK